MKKLLWFVFVMGYLYQDTSASLLPVDPTQISYVYFRRNPGAHLPTYYKPSTSEICQKTPQNQEFVIAKLVTDGFGNFYAQNDRGEMVTASFYEDHQNTGSPSGLLLFINIL